MIPVADRTQSKPFLEAFEELGFAHFPGVYDAPQVDTFQHLYADVVSQWRYVTHSEATPDAVSGLLERYPRDILPALSNPLLLGFAEAIMGPFVQLDSAVLNSDAPVEQEKRLCPVMWHRDRFGAVPPNLYLRPSSIVFLSYLQPMTDDVGPLRVIPRSHRADRLIPDAELYEPIADEVFIHAEPGDVIAVHQNLLHSGTHNTATIDRRFFGFIYNLTCYRQEDNFAGPNCAALLDFAKKTNDRRLARLLGHDPLIFPRQNSGFTSPPETQWAQWIHDDEAYAESKS